MTSSSAAVLEPEAPDPSGAPTPWRRPLTVSLLLLACLQALLTARFLPIAMTDESLYKGVAYELATHGRFAVPFAHGYYPGVESRFIPYPPVFFAALAGWFRLVGFGTLQNHLFSALLRLAAAALAGTLAGRLAETKKALWAPFAALAVFSYCRTDRPDPLAVTLALAALLVASGRRTRPRLVAAVALGAGALLVEPAAVLLYGTFFAVFGLGSSVRRSILYRCAAAVGALTILVQVYFYLADRESFRYFVRLCLHKLRLSHTDVSHVLFHESTRFWTPFFVLYAVVGALVLLRREGPASGDARAVVRGTAAALLVHVVVVPNVHQYLMLLLPLVVLSLAIWGSRETAPRWLPAAFGAALVVAFVPLGLAAARSFTLLKNDRYETAVRVIAETVPAGSLVVADGGLWTALVPRYEFRDFYWGRADLPKARWVVSLGVGTGRPGLSCFEATEPWTAARDFRVVYDGLVPEPQRLLGIPLGSSRLGYGIRIFERRPVKR